MEQRKLNEHQLTMGHKILLSHKVAMPRKMCTTVDQMPEQKTERGQNMGSETNRDREKSF